jgi:hypothetical protein
LFEVYEVRISGHQRFDRHVLDDTHRLILNTKRIDGILDLLNQFLWDDYRPGDDLLGQMGLF